MPFSEAAWLIGPNGTSETSGGEVEHEVYMLQSIILLVVELKLALKDEMDHVAQVLLDLVCVIVYIRCDVVEMSRTSRIYEINNNKRQIIMPGVTAQSRRAFLRKTVSRRWPTQWGVRTAPVAILPRSSTLRGAVAVETAEISRREGMREI